MKLPEMMRLPEREDFDGSAISKEFVRKAKMDNIKFAIPVIISLIALGVSIYSLTIQVQDRERKQPKPPQTKQQQTKKVYH